MPRISVKPGDLIEVPIEVATCGECNSRLQCYVEEYETDTGIPTECGVCVDCKRDQDELEDFVMGNTRERPSHSYWQCWWQPVIDRVTDWARKNVRVSD